MTICCLKSVAEPNSFRSVAVSIVRCYMKIHTVVWMWDTSSNLQNNSKMDMCPVFGKYS